MQTVQLALVSWTTPPRHFDRFASAHQPYRTDDCPLARHHFRIQRPPAPEQAYLRASLKILDRREAAPQNR